jgi:hypothetical protein
LVRLAHLRMGQAPTRSGAALTSDLRIVILLRGRRAEL